MVSKRNLFCSVLIIAALSISGLSAQKKKVESKSATQIRAVLNTQVEAWNRGDLEAFLKGYWRSPQLSFYSGATKTSGWDSTLERYKNRYKSEGREMGQLTFSELEIEMLSPTSAFVRGHWQLKMSSGDVGGLFTLIFRKFPDGWKIIHDHTGSSQG
jgi:beta-aspartyl-peptidase (threonine type)